jgi:hypothetical protein
MFDTVPGLWTLTGFLFLQRERYSLVKVRN